MGKYGEIQPGFMEERTRILEALEQPENKAIVLRLIGALAFRTHCPKYGYFQEALGRVFTDIDFAGYSKHYKDIARFLTELGYEEDKMVTRLFGDFRLVFHEEKFGRHIDVFLDKLDFCHVLPLKGRLEVDKPTIPLAELVVEKMQIVQINEKDVIDTIMLFREHRVGDKDKEMINGKLIAQLTSDDWGLWRTLTGNLDLTESKLAGYPQLTEDDRRVVKENIQELRTWIDSAPKTLKWRSRAVIGEKKKWYKDVEELEGRS
jgi:hypothetical protein